MDKLKYINNLLAKDNLDDYISKLELDNSISPPRNLKEKILSTCYDTKESKNNTNEKNTKKISFYDILKVACFALVIALCTELFVNATYASTKKPGKELHDKHAIYKVTDKINDKLKDISDLILNWKGE